MHNVAPSRPLARRSRNVLFIAIIVVLLGLLISVIGVALFVIPLAVPANPDFPVYDAIRRFMIGVGFVVMLVGLLLAARALTWRTDNTLAITVGNQLARFLDDRYTLMRNISKLSLGYIDAALIGPPGVLVFRVTDQEGVYYNEGAMWMVQKERGQWQTIRWNPTRECVADIKQLRKFLEARNLKDVPVFGIIVFTNDSPLTQFTVENPLVPPYHATELVQRMEHHYFAEERISDQTAQEIVQLLYN